MYPFVLYQSTSITQEREKKESLVSFLITSMTSLSICISFINTDLLKKDDKKYNLNTHPSPGTFF
jgi:hypothetical protein